MSQSCRILEELRTVPSPHCSELSSIHAGWVYSTDFLQNVRRLLGNAGPPGRALALQLANFEAQRRAEQAERMPESRGDVGAIVGEPFFLPLYKLFNIYGGVFRLTFGPKVRFLHVLLQVLFVIHPEFLGDFDQGTLLALMGAIENLQPRTCVNPSFVTNSMSCFLGESLTHGLFLQSPFICVLVVLLPPPNYPIGVTIGTVLVI